MYIFCNYNTDFYVYIRKKLGYTLPIKNLIILVDQDT